MSTLLLLRHAKSSWAAPNTLDHDRPLNPRGQEAATRVGDHLKENDLVPDLVLCSTAVRAQSTFKLASLACNFSGPVSFLPELYLAEPEAYFDALARLSGKAEKVLMIGHNPGLEALLSTLTGRVARMPTAALASLALEGADRALLSMNSRCKLLHFWTPKGSDD